MAQRKGERMNKLTKVIATAAITLALSAPAMATVNNAAGGTLFSGEIANTSNNTTGWVTISGSMPNASLMIHIVDAKFDTTCIVDEANEIVTTGDPGNLTGELAIYPRYCYETRNPTKFHYPTGSSVFNFDWADGTELDYRTMVAVSMNLMLPNYCLYGGFAGTGTYQP